MSREDFLSMVHALLPTGEWSALEKSLSVSVSKSISCCVGRISPQHLFSIAEHTNWQCSSTVFPVLDDIAYVASSNPTVAVGSHPLHQFGLCYMQEVAASIPAHFMDIPEGGVILDVSAAPGGKTTQLAHKAIFEKKKVVIRSNDLDAKRLPALVSNIERTGSYNTIVSKMDGIRIGENFPEMFDSILLDAPCSGEGTAFKSDDALKWRKIDNILQIAALQKQLLQSAMQALKV